MMEEHTHIQQPGVLYKVLKENETKRNDDLVHGIKGGKQVYL